MSNSDIHTITAEQNDKVLSADSYLNRLLVRYAGTFDLYTPYFLGGREFPAYGYFYSHVEKFVLTRGANMWSSDSYEHIVSTIYLVHRVYPRRDPARLTGKGG